MNKRASTTTALRPAQRGLGSFNAHRAERTTTHWFNWRHLRCKVQETPHYGRHGWTLLQFDIIASRDTPCPLTNTGYLAHGVDANELKNAGGAVAFLTEWMNRGASTKVYRQTEFRWRQGDLFHGHNESRSR